MPIKPKFTTETDDIFPKTARQFTNREFFINTFLSALNSNRHDKHNVLVFYGVGGIGKTSLRKELARIINKDYRNTVSASLDFDLAVYRQEETALYYLRKWFRDNYKIHFPSFEIAYAVYWKKTHPQTPINKHNFPLMDESMVVGSLVAILGSLPLVGLIPGITRTVLKGHKHFKEWWTKRGQKELYNLPELEAKDILDRLPMFFASDLKDYLSSNNKQCVIVIDSYQALYKHAQTNSGYLLQDEWVRELVAHLPQPVWVICSRDKLRWSEWDKQWDDYLVQYNIMGFTDEISEKFLCSCGIEDENLRKIIIETSKGVPYYLTLAADTYSQIKNIHNRTPETDDFARTQFEVLDRFLAYLDKTEIETLKVLSAARLWNREIFKLLIDKFNTGYPATAMNELCRFSFINAGPDAEIFTMHDLMKEGLQSRLDRKTLTDAHKCLFEYYDAKLINVDVKNISNEQNEALTEAFYHSRNYNQTQELYCWFEKRSVPFRQAMLWKFIIPLYEELAKLIEDVDGKKNKYIAEIMDNLSEGYTTLGLFERAISCNELALDIKMEIFGAVNLEYAKSLDNLGKVYTSLGKYNDAVPLHTKVLEIKKKLSTENTPEYATTLYNLAVAYSYLNEFKKAIALYQESLDITKKAYGPESMTCVDIMHSLAGVYSNMGEYEKAVCLILTILKITKEVLGENHPNYATILNGLASTYQSMGKYAEATELFIKAIDIRKCALGENHPAYAHSLNCLGSVYYHTGHFDEAIPLYEKSLEIRKNVLGENHPDYAGVLNNLAILYNDIGQFDKAIELHEKSLEIKKNTTGEIHTEYASSLINLAVVYFETCQYEKAIQYHKKAIEILKQVYGENHPHYGVALDNLAEVYGNIGQLDKALALHQKTYEILKKSLGENHPHYSYPLKNMAKVYVKKGNINKAIELLIEATDIMKKTITEKNPDYLRCIISLAECYLKAGETEKSLNLCNQVTKTYENLDDRLKIIMKEPLEHVVKIYSELNETNEAERVKEKINRLKV
jgi:tetratricopeptide (TPR) repeat protein